MLNFVLVKHTETRKGGTLDCLWGLFCFNFYNMEFEMLYYAAIGNGVSLARVGGLHSQMRVQ